MSSAPRLEAPPTSVDPAGPVPGSVHLLYVQERFPVLSETFVVREAERLRELGAAVSVATSRSPLRHWSATTPLDEPGTTGPSGSPARGHLAWARTALPRYLAFWWLVARAPLKDKPFMLHAPGIASVAQAAGVTHVHTHFAFRAASVARAVALLLDCPRSVTTHANDIFTRGAELPARVAGARVLTISRFNQRFLARRGIASEVNHCGIDIGASGLPGDLGPDDAGRTVDIVLAGRLVDKKGPLQLVEAVVRLAAERGSAPSVVVVGDGPLLSRCRALAAEHGLDVRFTGAQAPDETLRHIASARVFCLPCQEAPDGDLDGIPVVLMEAMALGTAVVTTPVSGIPELLDETSGWLVDGPDLVGALATALATALDDPAERRRRTAAAAQRVRTDFTLTQQARGVLAAAQASVKRVGPQ